GHHRGPSGLVVLVLFVVVFSNFFSLEFWLILGLQRREPPFKLDMIPQPHNSVDDPEGGSQTDVPVIIVEQVSEGAYRSICCFRQRADRLIEHPMTQLRDQRSISRIVKPGVSRPLTALRLFSGRLDRSARGD